MRPAHSEAFDPTVQAIPLPGHETSCEPQSARRANWVASITDRILKSSRSRSELEEIFRTFSPEAVDVAPWVTFSADGYTRNRISVCEEFELLVLCWRSGQLTPVHDHSGSACVVKVIQGTATEISYERSPCNLLVPTKTVRLECDSVTGSFDADVHQLGNLEAPGEDLVTLHCYSPPLLSMRAYQSEETFFGGYDSARERRLRRTDSAIAFQHGSEQSGT